MMSDNYWGTGIDGTGRNEYGLILMELRKELFDINCDETPSYKKLYTNLSEIQ